jgi:hypothetical protein
MKTWIKAMIWMLISRPIIRAVNWTDDERKAFDAFCKSSCGQKLLEYFRQVVASTTFAAVYRDSVSANAYSRGQQDLLALMHRLRSFSPEAESNSIDEDIEPLHSQRGAIDGRRFGLSGGGNSAIG